MNLLITIKATFVIGIESLGAKMEAETQLSTCT